MDEKHGTITHKRPRHAIRRHAEDPTEHGLFPLLWLSPGIYWLSGISYFRRSPAMSHPFADRNLVYGVLALQMNFISWDTLFAAMNTWILHKERSTLECGSALDPPLAFSPDSKTLATAASEAIVLVEVG